jgi:hypothetical protein
VARFAGPEALTYDGIGSLYIADTTNATIRQLVTATGAVTTIAGLPGMVGSTDGTGSAARFGYPTGIVYSGAGSLFVADWQYSNIREVALPSGVVTTLAGLAGAIGSADGAGANARFSGPHGLASDGAGHLFVADSGNNTVREVVPGGVVSTLAGVAGVTGLVPGPLPAALNGPFGLAVLPGGGLAATLPPENVVVLIR